MKIKVLFLLLAGLFFYNIGVNAQSMLAAGTQITMFDDKTKGIEEVVVGDKILVYNLQDKVYEEVKVKNINKVMVNRLVRITLDNGIQLDMTADQPLYGEKGWVSVYPELTAQNPKYEKVSRCEIGEFILLYNIKSTDYVEITVIQGILEPVDTYALELESDGVYVANGFLVGQN